MKKDEHKTHISGAGEVVEQKITDTLELNYMPYAMSVIMSRAIPEIDGLKPSHRKLLYTMYKMGLLRGARTKSANIVGTTMKLNPHGDQAIYDTMVRLSKGYEALLYPYVDSKGNFGKSYSRDMQWAAPRYTEAKLTPICNELFCDIDFDTVDFVDNYDNTMKEPLLLPVRFPSILVNLNSGIAVGMASSICSFNLEEIANATIGLIDDDDYDVRESINAPDFIGGGTVIIDRKEFNKILDTGKGSLKIRGNYEYDKKNNCIDIKQIAPTTTCEAIIDKVIEKVKSGELKEISDIRDESDKNGLKITIDLKRGTNVEILMQKLYKLTPLEDSFSCNFNILVGGGARVLGVTDILREWIAFRFECVRRRVYFKLQKAKNRLHLLEGLSEILLDIDKAIKIIRETEDEDLVIPNLMIGFGIDEIQADFVAEIKLKNLNKQFILRKLEDIEQLKADIEKRENILKNKSAIDGIIKDELKEIVKKYNVPRKTQIIYEEDVVEFEPEEEIDDSPVFVFFTKEGYFKKITPQSLRMSGEQNLKPGDKIIFESEETNDTELLFFTDKANVYKSKASDFENSKASVLGDYVASELEAEKDENIIFMAPTRNYEGFLMFFYEDGRVAKVELKAYETKTNRKKLLNACSTHAKLINVIVCTEDKDFIIHTTEDRYLIFSSAQLTMKLNKNVQGVKVASLKKNAFVDSAEFYDEEMFVNPTRYKSSNLPFRGAKISKEDAKSNQYQLF
ncbi:MAG: DNA topoisomerase (ATP-hydrolyzing) subunit A [Clostridia bacterium]|nr:DNA topoisomerase (ATP-hydrolyzing) subunit A [Clostridia bacterium]